MDQNKLSSLEAAIEKYVKSGSHISIGGFTANRVPMAAVYEIIRQQIRDLHVYAHSNGQGVDELVGAGCVKKLEIAYAGNGGWVDVDVVVAGTDTRSTQTATDLICRFLYPPSLEGRRTADLGRYPGC